MYFARQCPSPLTQCLTLMDTMNFTCILQQQYLKALGFLRVLSVIQQLCQKPHDFLVVFCRFYVQLPTETSHEFHDQMVAELEALENNQDIPTSVVTQPRSRLHPKVADKVRELVAGGETRLYAIRKFLRLVAALSSTQTGPWWSQTKTKAKFWTIFSYVLCVEYYDSFTLTETNSGTDSDSDSKPNG